MGYKCPIQKSAESPGLFRTLNETASRGVLLAPFHRMGTNTRIRSTPPVTSPLAPFEESKTEHSDSVLRRCSRCGASVEEIESESLKSSSSSTCNHGVFFDELKKQKALTDNSLFP